LAHLSNQIHVDKYQSVFGIVERFKLSWNFKLKFIVEKNLFHLNGVLQVDFSFIRTICCHVL
jgi:hypothetical protein